MPRSPFVSLVALASTAAVALSAAPTSACSTGGGGNVVAYPPAGTMNVSPGTTIFLASMYDDNLAVLVNGAPLDGVTDVAIGAGVHNDDVNAETFRKLVFPQMSLPPGAHLEVRVRGNTSPDGTVLATSFDTSSSSDATAGTPPVISALRIWRVQYPKSEIGSGNCVSSEFWAFIEADWSAATVPNTTPPGLVHVFSLAPKAGGAAQSYVLGGTAPVIGHAPDGDHPFPLAPGWHPTIDGGVEYCITAQAFGDGDLVRPALVSEPMCATAVEIVVPGAGGTGGAGGIAGSGGTGATGGSPTGEGGFGGVGVAGTSAGGGSPGHAGTGSGAVGGTSSTGGTAAGGVGNGGVTSSGGAPAQAGAGDAAAGGPSSMATGGMTAAGGQPGSSTEAAPAGDSSGGGCSITSSERGGLGTLVVAALGLLTRIRRARRRTLRR